MPAFFSPPWLGSGDDGGGCAATAAVAGDSLAAWPRVVLALPVLQRWKAGRVGSVGRGWGMGRSVMMWEAFESSCGYASCK